MKAFLRFIALSLLLLVPASAQQGVQLPSGNIWGNPGASRALGQPSAPTAILDRAFSSTQGSMLYRNSTTWLALAPGTAGLPLLSGGASANLAYGILGPAAGGTGVNNGASTFTIGGNLATVGTFSSGGNFSTNSTFSTAGATALPAIVQGDLWYGSAAGTISALAKTASASNVICNTGTSNNPAWCQLAALSLSNGTTGSGSIVLGTSPAIASPAFSGTVTGANTIPLSILQQVSGGGSFLGVPAAATGNVTSFTPGSLTNKTTPALADQIVIADSAASGALKYSTITQIVGSVGVASIDSKTGSFTTGNGLDSSGGNVIELTAARRTLPTTQVFLSGSGTYTTPANVLWIEIYMVGGGGGGAASGTSPGAATAGNNTCWNTTGAACTSPVYEAGGGTAGLNNGAPSSGGTISGSGTCILSQPGGNGGATVGTASTYGSMGGSSRFGGAGVGGNATSSSATPGVGQPAAANSGSGGGGAGDNATTSPGGGGGGGAYCHAIINSPASTYTYAVAGTAAGGTLGTNGSAGGLGAAGSILVIEHYGS